MYNKYTLIKKKYTLFCEDVFDNVIYFQKEPLQEHNNMGKIEDLKIKLPKNTDTPKQSVVVQVGRKFYSRIG